MKTISLLSGVIFLMQAAPCFGSAGTLAINPDNSAFSAGQKLFPVSTPRAVSATNHFGSLFIKASSSGTAFFTGAPLLRIAPGVPMTAQDSTFVSYSPDLDFSSVNCSVQGDGNYALNVSGYSASNPAASTTVGFFEQVWSMTNSQPTSWSSSDYFSGANGWEEPAPAPGSDYYSYFTPGINGGLSAAVTGEVYLAHLYASGMWPFFTIHCDVSVASVRE